MASSFAASFRLLPLALSLLAGLGGCGDNESMPVPALGTEYFPLQAGTYRIYNVTDTTYTRNVPSVVSYQFRESIARTDVFRDAAGQQSYKVLRAKRIAPTAAWETDSVFTFTPTKQTVTLLRDNRRTVELIFPVRENRAWNLNAYTNLGGDTITDLNRRYHRVGQPLTLTSGGVTKTYAETVTTLDEGNAAEDDLYYLTQYQQVFAKGVGAVLRRRRRFFYTDGNGGSLPVPGQIYQGRIRYEMLVETGTL